MYTLHRMANITIFFSFFYKLEFLFRLLRLHKVTVKQNGAIFVGIGAKLKNIDALYRAISINYYITLGVFL